ncbi:MAG: TIGR00725 family protein [Thermoplasmata archaeon]|nr:TIGR00725 family protein [Thermoplasmata archaeon]
MLLIGVIGSSSEDEDTNKLAYDVGRLIAENGAALVCGGLGGVMLHACKGARDASGMTIGVIPTDKKDDANPYVDVPIVTGMGWARNVIIAETADAVIAVGGSYGTLSEIGHTMNAGKKVFALNSWDVLKNDENFIAAKGPEEAVDLAIKHARTSGSNIE